MIPNVSYYRLRLVRFGFHADTSAGSASGVPVRTLVGPRTVWLTTGTSPRLLLGLVREEEQTEAVLRSAKDKRVQVIGA